MGNTVPRLVVALSRDRYVLTVYTGDRKSAGTDANVYVQLRDTSGHVTAPRHLDHWLFNDLERGSVVSYPMPDDDQLTEVDSLIVRRDNSGIGDAWFLDLISVEDRHASVTYTFPVHRWVQPDTEYRLKQHDISLPQHDDDDIRARRAHELELKREQYQYVQRLTDGPAQIKQIPEDEQFSFSYKFDFLREKARLLMKTSSMKTPTGRWSTLKELSAGYRSSLGEPQAMRYWSSDRWFGLQRVQGVNPVLIRLCTSIPEKLAVNGDMLGPLLEGYSLQQALDYKKLFIVDLQCTEGIPHVEGTQLCSPVALFYLNKQGHLLPVAIQLFQKPGPDNPVFLPSDPPNLWLLAKLYYNNADAQQHQSCTHLGYTHLIMEGVAICTHRQLSPSHPVFRLMAPHFLYLIAINTRGLEKLISPGGWVDKGMTVGLDGMFELIRRGLSEWRMDTDGNVRRQVEARGVLDPDVLPYYPYRDDAMALQAALRRYVSSILQMIYVDSAALEQDWELQAWRRELVTDRSAGGVGMLGVYGDDEKGFTQVEQLVDTVTSIITTCSVGHAAANFAQYEEYGFVPNYPGILFGRAPSSRTQAEPTEADVVAALPDVSTTRDIMVITRLLSFRGTRRLGDFEVRYLYDPTGSHAAETLRHDLLQLSRSVKIRNANSEFPYQWLDPEYVPNSISV